MSQLQDFEAVPDTEHAEPAEPENHEVPQFAITEQAIRNSFLTPPPHNLGEFITASDWEVQSWELSGRPSAVGGTERSVVVVWMRDAVVPVRAVVEHPPVEIVERPFSAQQHVGPNNIPSRQFLPVSGVGPRPTGNPRDTATNAPGMVQSGVQVLSHAPVNHGATVVVHDRGFPTVG